MSHDWHVASLRVQDLLYVVDINVKYKNDCIKSKIQLKLMFTLKHSLGVATERNGEGSVFVSWLWSRPQCVT